ANFTSEAGSSDNSTQTLRNGDTVLVAQGYDTSKGTSGAVYQYKGGSDADDEDDISLYNENYKNTSNWTLVAAPDTLNLATQDYANSKLWELADGTITARVGAASLAASF